MIAGYGIHVGSHVLYPGSHMGTRDGGEHQMAASPKPPLTLVIMILQRYVERIREALRAQGFPEPDLDPRSHDPFTAGQPPAAPSSARSSSGVASSSASSSRVASRRPPSSLVPSPRVPSSRVPSPRGPSPPVPPAGTMPERRHIPEPVGERHNRRIPQDVKIAVSARDGGSCRQCGSTQNLHFDHIIPVSRGGANTVANIQLLCGPCNRAKSAK
jgi:5-methylcytosine-specific restriction endonuclease McrA